jgi:hypothetical protein
VCPLVAAVVRAYNDAVDDRRRQDLYRFAADAVGTRGDFTLQRKRAEVALHHALQHARRPGASQKALQHARRPGAAQDAPDPEAGPEEIAEHVVRSLARRPGSRSPRRRWDDASHAEMLLLLERLIATGGLGGNPLLGEFVEHPPEPIEDGGGDEQFLVAELGHGGAEPGLELAAPSLDELLSPVGELGEHHAPVLVGAGALHEPGLGESVEHLGHAGGTEVRGVGQLARGETPLLALPEPEEQSVLSVAEPSGHPDLPAAHPPKSGHRAFERPAELLGGIALLALARHAGRRFATRGG